MGQINNDDSGKVERKDDQPARPATANASVWEDVQVEMPIEMVDAHGVSTQQTAKITITKPAFIMLCSVLVQAFDLLGVVVREQVEVEEEPGQPGEVPA